MTKLSEIADRYDALFCDVWGVIRDGHSLLPPAVEALQAYRKQGGRVCLVSNSPRRHPSLLEALGEMGFPGDAYDCAVTSGDAIHEELVKRAPGKAFKIGPDWDEALYDGLDLDFVGIEDADFISCTGPDDYWNGRPEHYQQVLEAALERKLDLVCANPDIIVQAGDQMIFCAGAIARLYRELGGISIVAGKPHRPIYRQAFDALAESGGPVEPSRVLAIGDGPETDIEGAARAGVDAMLIAGGILQAEMQDDGFSTETVVAILAEYGVEARWIAPQLVWS